MKKVKSIFIMWLFIIFIGSFICGLICLPFLFKRPGESWMIHVDIMNVILMLGYSSVFSIPGLFFFIFTLGIDNNYDHFIKQSRIFILISIFITFCIVILIFWQVSGQLGSSLLLTPLFIPYALAAWWVTHLLQKKK